ncbi:MAG: XdhC family protein [Holophagales bacterium]|nr:XdhC family protein [Holophagales bacterium]
MRDILDRVRAWRGDGEPVALATVVKVWGSAPRPLGSKMAISGTGDMVGSVSGGCVEGAVFEEAQEVLESGRPKLVSFGVSNDDAWAVGLSCGGRIDIFIESLGGPASELADGPRPGGT